MQSIQPWWRPKQVVAALALMVLSHAPSLSAQLGIEGLFGNVTDISFSSGCWDTSSKAIQREGACPIGNNEFGIEISFRVRELHIGHATDSLEVSTTPKTVRRVHADGKVTTDTTYDVTVERFTNGWHAVFELGLGYSQFTGFKSAAPDLDLRGAVRELPALSFYAAVRNREFPFGAKFPDISPYVGVRSGLIQLKDLQIVTPVATAPQDSAVSYTGDGQTFQIGVVGGLSAGYRRFSVFGEYALMYRKFESIKWSTQGTNKIPQELPQELDFTGPSFTVGLQIRIR